MSKKSFWNWLQKIFHSSKGGAVRIRITFPAHHRRYVGGEESLEANCLDVIVADERQPHREIVLDRYVRRGDRLLQIGSRLYYVPRQPRAYVPVRVEKQKHLPA